MSSINKLKEIVDKYKITKDELKTILTEPRNTLTRLPKGLQRHIKNLSESALRVKSLKRKKKQTYTEMMQKRLEKRQKANAKLEPKIITRKNNG